MLASWTVVWRREVMVSGEPLVVIARRSGMRIVGPNCLGVSGARRPLDATFVPHAAPPGRVGLLSQSGGVGLALLEHVASLSAALPLGHVDLRHVVAVVMALFNLAGGILPAAYVFGE